MTIITEGKNSFFLTTPAILIDETKDVASNWASDHIKANPALKWVLGKYVEADNANSNGQYWTLDDLRISSPTINHSPMNIDHHQNEIVGTWVASELLYPTDDKSNIINPYVEVLGVFWKAYFPEMLDQVQAAFDSGMLHISMECVGQSVTCTGTDAACGQTFDYAGSFSDTYCSHIQNRESYRQINQPHFLGGALIVPPNKPGWKDASVNEIANLTTDEEADSLIEQIAENAPDASASEWEAMMWQIQLQKFTTLT